jgi:hypothetical protein
LKATRLNSFKGRLENFYAIYSGIFRTDLVFSLSTWNAISIVMPPIELGRALTPSWTNVGTVGVSNAVHVVRFFLMQS